MVEYIWAKCGDNAAKTDGTRGPDEQTSGMFSYLSPEQRVRTDHPLRAVQRMTDQVFAALSPRFTQMYSTIGRPSIPPEQLLRALLLQSLYTVQSKRLLMEEIDYSLLYRWFIGLGMDDPIWSPTTFSKNRDRLLQSDIAGAFFDAVVGQARDAGLLSDEHFTVDGTLLEAWAGLKSFRRKDEGPQKPPADPGNAATFSPDQTDPLPLSLTAKKLDVGACTSSSPTPCPSSYPSIQNRGRVVRVPRFGARWRALRFAQTVGPA